MFTERQKPGNGMPLPPFEVDHEVTEEWARRDGKSSLGSIGPSRYPKLAGTSRLAGMILLDAVAGRDYAPSSYTKLFRFHQALYYNQVVTHLAKRNFNRHRPDGSDTQSFFSGHTSTAFAASTFFYLELRDFIDGQARAHEQRLPLLSPRDWKLLSFSVLYGWAAYVGYSRIHDKKHYLSDVLVGAASGTLVSYLLYPHAEKEAAPARMKVGLAPMNGGTGVGLSLDF
jgi:membrane-associated phospholipid phosphatase